MPACSRVRACRAAASSSEETGEWAGECLVDGVRMRVDCRTREGMSSACCGADAEGRAGSTVGGAMRDGMQPGQYQSPLGTDESGGMRQSRCQRSWQLSQMRRASSRSGRRQTRHALDFPGVVSLRRRASSARSRRMGRWQGLQLTPFSVTSLPSLPWRVRTPFALTCLTRRISLRARGSKPTAPPSFFV